MSTRADRIARAPAVRLEDELARRGVLLKRQGRELVGPCPICGGHDRFAVHLDKQLWNCRICSKGGDVIALVRHLDNISFPKAIDVLTGKLHQQPAPIPTSTSSRADNATSIQGALRIWREARSIVGTLAERYLAGRGIVELPSESGEVLRFHRRCPFGRGVDSKTIYRPCMLALVRNAVTNEPQAIYRTALTSDATKLGRMAYGPTHGGAIKLWGNDYITTGLVIGEGVETTLSAASMAYRATLLRPAWALGDAGHIRDFPVLAGIDALTILVDNDVSGTGQRAAEACARRWVEAGLEVTRLVPK
jgi:phage/plasmid primase-like uncharacterized protein